MSLALVDADSIYFRTCFVTKNKKEIRKYIRKTLSEIESHVMGEHFDEVKMMIAVKGKGNFRKDLYPDYKATRPELDKDMKEALNYAHNFMVEDVGAVRADGMEADDLVSIWAAEAREMEIAYTVAGIDKDLLQIPGSHYNFVRGTSQVVTADEAQLNLMLQCLTGDGSDNIPGIKGIGPKKASKILAGLPSDRLWNRVRAAWRGHGAGDPTLSLRLLQMLTSWEEFEDVKAQVAAQTSERKPNVLSEQEED